MRIARELHLQKLIDAQHNGLIKVITGMRRCGKSYLLNELFRDYLLHQGIDDGHILRLAFDMRSNHSLRDPDALCDFVRERTSAPGMHYLLLDEIQLVEDFEGVLNDFLHSPNLDVYVTGSNSRFLSSDIITEFRGRGYEIHLQPLSFAEFLSAQSQDRQQAWNSYLLYGGMPFLFNLQSDEQKADYLKRLFAEVYKRDITDRYRIRMPDELDRIVSILASSVGSLTSPVKLSKTFESMARRSISPSTITRYCGYLEDAFLVNRVKRFDLRGKRYIGTLYKYYFQDIGLRNAHLNFRQYEESHLMENVIYNELLLRGYNVDVGIVEGRQTFPDGHSQRQTYEIDFVANLGSRRYYIQSALQMPTADKREQENRPLRKTGDAFRKIIVTGDHTPLWHNEDGHTIINVLDFLLRPDSLDL